MAKPHRADRRVACRAGRLRVTAHRRGQRLERGPLLGAAALDAPEPARLACDTPVEPLALYRQEQPDAAGGERGDPQHLAPHVNPLAAWWPIACRAAPISCVSHRPCRERGTTAHARTGPDRSAPPDQGAEPRERVRERFGGDRGEAEPHPGLEVPPACGTRREEHARVEAPLEEAVELLAGRERRRRVEEEERPRLRRRYAKGRGGRAARGGVRGPRLRDPGVSRPRARARPRAASGGRRSSSRGTGRLG